MRSVVSLINFFFSASQNQENIGGAFGRLSHLPLFYVCVSNVIVFVYECLMISRAGRFCYIAIPT